MCWWGSWCDVKINFNLGKIFYFAVHVYLLYTYTVEYFNLLFQQRSGRKRGGGGGLCLKFPSKRNKFGRIIYLGLLNNF